MLEHVSQFTTIFKKTGESCAVQRLRIGFSQSKGYITFKASFTFYEPKVPTYSHLSLYSCRFSSGEYLPFLSFPEIFFFFACFRVVNVPSLCFINFHINLLFSIRFCIFFFCFLLFLPEDNFLLFIIL